MKGQDPPFQEPPLTALSTTATQKFAEGPVVEPVNLPAGKANPASVYAPLAGEPFAQLLDWRGGTGWAYVLADPAETFIVSAIDFFAGREHDIFQRLEARLTDWASAHSYRPGITPAPFAGGAAGFFAYELAHDIEHLPEPGAPFAADDTGTPVLAVGFYDAVAAFPADGSAPLLLSPWDTAKTRAKRARLRALIEGAKPLAEPETATCPEPASNFTRADYEAAVARTVEYIHAGDVFQVNLAQRFETERPDGLSAFDIFRRLGKPAPFAMTGNYGDVELVSSSPERFLRVDSSGHVLTEPIKGTRPRGRTREEDAANARDLAASEKDRAENVMIVDLLRNDLSRVCAPHSVKVTELCGLHSFSNVHHLVSAVEGRLVSGASPLDLLRACFPGGSITGAPKVRAMEIIAELEPHTRGPYCGAIGFIGLDGAMDTSIAIRTLTIRGNRVLYHAGGGIVADSNPAAEYEETLAKATAMRAALTGRAP